MTVLLHFIKQFQVSGKENQFFLQHIALKYEDRAKNHDISLITEITLSPINQNKIEKICLDNTTMRLMNIFGHNTREKMILALRFSVQGNVSLPIAFSLFIPVHVLRALIQGTFI